MSGDFLSRWSRLKRDGARPVRETPDRAGETAPPPGPDAAEPELPPEELARLPSLDALTPQTDLAQFLRAGVPRALRNAALRRMWSLDPAIRDFVSEAREYAWDWNVPGDVPGAGPLLPTDDVAAMVERVIAGEPARAAPGHDPADGPSGRESVVTPALPGPQAPPALELAREEAAREEAGRDEAGREEAPDAAGTGPDAPPRHAAEPAQIRPEAPENAAKRRRARRHGGAMPL
ncbi:conserved hypothetical protein [Methylobacterium sp. 4-46]|uniref:DUF3306 domain-containing protein n=1 Tax=unclassified Methylobacterium TaxID=2615210 RepID=UPI000152CFBA|nr:MULTISPECIES: DUF3306 domain-containing protein [Methylobacterium]ACA17494.1 conserved hypothetical protein [Methylobacterium sp. 4-46]WFT83178.1 DUF3306 domain-containing protein [Methylobacterium nodulans]